VDLAGLRVERVREFGEVYLALSLWRLFPVAEITEAEGGLLHDGAGGAGVVSAASVGRTVG
jgi:hypothetical protein